MAMLNSRYSRLTIALAVIIVLLLIQLVFAPLERPEAFRWRHQPATKSQQNLQALLDYEESRYDDTLTRREALVKKYGPKPEDVVAFPSTGAPYTVWNFFEASFQCPHRVERIGTMDDGGKWFCGIDRLAKQRTPCVIYSFGINGESSFEAELLKAAPHCQVWGYDFSVSSFGPEIENNPALKSRAHFFPYALGGSDAPHSEPPYYTLQTLMKRNGHTFIDVLKVDIEGAEFSSIDSFINHFAPPSSSQATIPIGQLQMEIHLRDEHSQFAPFKTWWENLERVGLRPFYTEPNLPYISIVRGALPDLSEYSFLNIRADYAVTDDQY